MPVLLFACIIPHPMWNQVRLANDNNDELDRPPHKSLTSSPEGNHRK